MKPLLKIFPASFLIGILIFLFAAVPSAYAATEVVAAANAAINNWSYSSTSQDGITAFVPGPGTPPLGTGSFRLNTGSHGEAISEIKIADAPGNPSPYTGANLSPNPFLNPLSSLSYSTYAVSWNGSRLPFLIMEVDNTQDGGSGDVLYWYPELNAGQSGQPTPSLNTWQSWNAYSTKWLSTNTPLGEKTLVEYAMVFPNAKVGPGGIKVAYGLGNSSDIFDGYVDNFTIGVEGNATTFDFEHYVVTCELADVNDDFGVDLTDTLLILDFFGMVNQPTYDMDASGDIDLTDALLNLELFGETCSTESGFVDSASPSPTPIPSPTPTPTPSPSGKKR